MQTRGPLILLLVLAIVAVDLVAVSAVLHAGPSIFWPHPTLGLFLALVCAQVSLVATWVGLSRRPLPWPVAAAVVVVIAAWALLAVSLSGKMPSTFGTVGWLIVLSLQAIAVVGPLWIARLAGIRLVAPDDLRRTERTDPDRPVQFSIGYLLGWMTALAVVLGLLRWVARGDLLTLGDSDWSDRHAWLDVAVLSMGNAVIAWPAPWAVLGTRRRIAGTVVLCLAAGGLIAVYALLSGSAAHRWTLTLFCAAQMAVLVAALGVFRIIGYRLVRRSGAHR